MRTDELALDYVSDVLLRIRRTRPLPDWFENRIDFMVRVSGDLARKRGPAFYGIERSVMPASKLFDREEGLKALKDAGEVFDLCVKLIKGK